MGGLEWAAPRKAKEITQGQRRSGIGTRFEAWRSRKEKGRKGQLEVLGALCNREPKSRAWMGGPMEMAEALGEPEVGSEPRRADPQPPGPNGTAAPGSESPELCWVCCSFNGRQQDGVRDQALCWVSKPPLPHSAVLQTSVSPPRRRTPALYLSLESNVGLHLEGPCLHLPTWLTPLFLQVSI